MEKMWLDGEGIWFRVGSGGVFPGVGWVISAALDDWDERLSFPVACRGRMGRGASLSTWR